MFSYGNVDAGDGSYGNTGSLNHYTGSIHSFIKEEEEVHYAVRTTQLGYLAPLMMSAASFVWEHFERRDNKNSSVPVV